MRLSTGCRPIDHLLGGGLEPGAITLVYGEAGTGKTNLCLEAAIAAARTHDAKVAYVDTEGVSMERFEQIAQGDRDAVLKRILFYAPADLAEQEKMIASLAKLQRTRLVIVDSMNMHYRLGLGTDSEEPQRSVTRQLAALLAMARNSDVAILVTGQVYGSDEDVRPWGGRVMEHIVKTMVRLERTGVGRRRAVVHKHRSQPEGAQCPFRITATGLE